IYKLFCIYCCYFAVSLFKSINRSIKRKILPNLKSIGGRPSKLSLSEIVSLALFRYATGTNDIKHFHRHLLTYYKGWFRIPNYSSFNRLINQATFYVMFLFR
ncbi:MAG: hypothetical protein QMD92_07805, partial [bacterium]|nr:hypothetical protein [bacterium]